MTSLLRVISEKQNLFGKEGDKGETYTFTNPIVTGGKGKHTEIVGQNKGREKSISEYRLERIADRLLSWRGAVLLTGMAFFLASYGLLGETAQGFSVGAINTIVSAVDMAQGGMEVYGQIKSGELELNGGLVEIMQYASANGSFDAHLIDPSAARTVYKIFEPVVGESVNILSGLGQ